MNNRELGVVGEEIAHDFLKKEGYIILDKNYWCRYGEIDLIAKDGNYLVFVEVKLLRGRSFAHPLEQITYHKKEHLKRVARYYLSNYGINSDFRFDVVAILKDKKKPSIKVIKNAFLS